LPSQEKIGGFVSSASSMAECNLFLCWLFFNFSTDKEVEGGGRGRGGGGGGGEGGGIIAFHNERRQRK